MSTYQYQPISASGEIRILQVRPGRRADPFDCCLKRLSLASVDRDDYHAVSYAWEGQTPTEPIRLDGQSFLVTHNIFSALKHLRLRKKRRTLWIDAVCIDQQNKDERMHQVAQMKAVFGAAKKVIVWLGDEDENSMFAMNRLRAATPGDGSAVLGSLVHLFRRPWWRRIWVLQEVVAAQETPIIKCGDEEVNWERLSCVLWGKTPTTWMEFLFGYRGLGHNLENLTQLVASRDAFLSLANHLRDNRERLSWREAFTLQVTMRASDQRDLTYALLGLMPDAVQGRIIPDYRRDTAAVYDTTIKVALDTDCALETLALAVRPFDSLLPSWIPDLEHGTSTLFLENGVDLYNASGTSSRNVQFLEDGRIMVIAGALIDYVSEITEESDHNRMSQSKSLAFRHGAESGLERDQIQERFWRTLIMNQGKSWPISDTTKVQYPAPHEHGRRYMVWQEEAEVPAEEVGPGEASEWRLEYTKPYIISLSRLWARELARFFTTVNGCFGITQKGIQSGDAVCLFAGGKVAYMLREYQVSEVTKAMSSYNSSHGSCKTRLASWGQGWRSSCRW